MIGLVLVTHAGLATALKLSAEMIVGAIECCTTVEVAPDERADVIMARVVAAVEAVQSDGAIIMTDLFGGTPSNMAMSFLKEGCIEVVTGVNLPMMIEFCSRREQMPVAELALDLHRTGREGIIVAGEFLK
jgi:PTS system mannose-specific IIA component